MVENQTTPKYNFLVTGGAGFIGSHIVETLLTLGHNVRVLDNFSTGKEENIESFKDKIQLVRADIRDYDAMNEAFKGIHYVSHQAAMRSVPLSCDDPVSANDINVSGTMNVLMAAKEHKVKRIVFASSSSVYGDSLTYPQTEDQQLKPCSPYAASKLAGELYLNVFYKIFGVEAVSLRYFNVFGPRQDPKSQYAAVIPHFIMHIANGTSPQVHGDGLQTRDFTYVKNVADANIAAALAPGFSGMAVNVAMGTPKSVLDVLSTINGIMGKDVKPDHTPARQGDVRQTWADVSNLKELLDLNQAVKFPEGLKKTVDWFLTRYC